MKAVLAYSRNVTRDYLDFAALVTGTTEDRAMRSLMALDDQYRGLQTSSMRLEIAKALAAASPFDLEGLDLGRYKGLAPEWRDWRRTEQICRRFGTLLAERLMTEGAP